jgi:hypothetical protein
LAFRAIVTSASASELPSATLVALPSITRRVGSMQTAASVLPSFIATALLTVASGQVGAPDLCRVCTANPGSVSASKKSPAASKS